MAFHVGQMVVCVDALPSFDGVPVPLVESEIYTIAVIETHYDDGIPAFHLEEVETPPDRETEDFIFCGGFCSTRFRPVRKTDISIFTSLLAPTERETV